MTERLIKDAVEMLIGAMCSTAQRENFCAEFKARTQRPGENPAVYKWDLGQKLLKADLLLEDQAKEALLLRQLMRGLPRNLKIRMLENDPTPTLANMVALALYNGIARFKNKVAPKIIVMWRNRRFLLKIIKLTNWSPWSTQSLINNRSWRSL